MFQITLHACRDGLFDVTEYIVVFYIFKKLYIVESL